MDLAVEAIGLLLRDKYDETADSLGHNQIVHLLKFCIKTYFRFDGTICRQAKGTPTRSPISRLITEAVPQQLESLASQQHTPKFWAQYVNDTIVVIGRDQVLTLKEHINAVYPDIQFATKGKENEQLAFLDVLDSRKAHGSLKTKVLTKLITSTATTRPVTNSVA
ncbi:hypothetical protein SprV_0401696200 [Sparganum proliferum]